ncbi:MAG: hypothetical protein U0414_36960 [Polyangiaceae bacterium]
MLHGPAARRFALLLAAAIMVAAPGSASATERQWFFGGSVGYAYIDETTKWWDGGFVMGETRYGITDAIDFAADLNLGLYPAADQLVPSADVGLAYVLDVSRFVPHVGATIGLSDVITYGCPEGFRPCGHELYPVVGIPAGFDVRVTKHLSLGAHFRYGFMLFAGNATSQINVGASLAFATFPGDPSGPSTIPPRSIAKPQGASVK